MNEDNLLCNIVAEELVLNAVLTIPSAVEKLLGILTPEMFFSSLHGRIFEVCVKLSISGQRISAEDVYKYLDTQQELAGLAVGSDNMQTVKLIQSRFITPNFVEYAENIKAKWQSRRYRDAMQESIAYFENEDFETARSWLDQKLAELQKQDSSDLRSMGAVMTDAIKTLETIFISNESGESLSLIMPTGLNGLDRILDDGIPRQRLISLLGATGMGKTTCLLHLLTQSAKLKLPTAFFSLEMSAESQAFKLFSKHNRVRGGDLQSGNFDPNQFTGFFETNTKYMNEAPLWINDRIRCIEDIVSSSRQFYAKHGEIGIIGIDYLTLVKSRVFPKLQIRERVDYVLEELNQLKKDLDTRIVVLCQIGRDVKNSGDKRPTIYSAKESGGIEEASDLMLGVYRDEVYNPETTDRGIIEIITLKNRYGSCGTAKLLWDGAHSTIDNIENHF